jgi:CRP/FNR family transcriptional regulator
VKSEDPLPFARALARHPAAVRPVHPAKVAELPASVGFGELAAFVGVIGPRHADLPDERFTVRRLRADETLHRQGDAFRSLYVVRSGFFKTTRMVNDHGAEQVIGFPVGGDAVGADSLGCDTHATTTSALLPSTVIIVPYARFVRLARGESAAQALLEHLVGSEMGRRLETISLLGALKADERVAAFLLSMGERLARTGYSRTVVSLPMTRADIGRYLGIRCETVIRAMSRLADAGIISIGRHSVTIRERDLLRQIVATARVGDLHADDDTATRIAIDARDPRQARA